MTRKAYDNPEWDAHTRHGQWIRDYQARRAAASTSDQKPVRPRTDKGGVPLTAAASGRPPTPELAIGSRE